MKDWLKLRVIFLWLCFITPAMGARRYWSLATASVQAMGLGQNWVDILAANLIGYWGHMVKFKRFNFGEPPLVDSRGSRVSSSDINPISC